MAQKIALPNMRFAPRAVLSTKIGKKYTLHQKQLVQKHFAEKQFALKVLCQKIHSLIKALNTQKMDMKKNFTKSVLQERHFAQHLTSTNGHFAKKNMTKHFQQRVLCTKKNFFQNNFFVSKNSKFLRNQCQPLHKGLFLVDFWSELP